MRWYSVHLKYLLILRVKWEAEVCGSDLVGVRYSAGLAARVGVCLLVGIETLKMITT